MISDSEKEMLGKIVSENMGVSLLTLNPDKPLHDQIALDSMHLIGLVARVENAFGIELPLSILQIATLTEFYQVIDDAIIVRTRSSAN